jgi:hypothetical protein
MENAGNPGNRIDKIAHHRLVFSFTNPAVQHIEHAFTTHCTFLREPRSACKMLFNILNKYSILGTVSFLVQER